METVIVIAVVGLAALSLARRAKRTFVSGGGCGGPCPAATRLAGEVARAARK